MGDVAPPNPPPTQSGPPYGWPTPIQAGHDLSQFTCGHDSLDDWLKNTALKSEGRSARTYVVCEGSVVVGYYSIAMGAVARTSAPKKIARNTPDPIPVVVLGRLAVAKSRAGQGIGTGMLRDAFNRILQLAEAVGCRAVLVHAIDQSAVDFYAKFQFAEFPGGTRTLFLPLETIRQSLP